jgi:hypothetical protein
VPYGFTLAGLARFQIRYRDNPYHNFEHAFTVAHVAYLFLTETALSEIVEDFEASRATCSNASDNMRRPACAVQHTTFKGALAEMIAPAFAPAFTPHPAQRKHASPPRRGCDGLGVSCLGADLSPPNARGLRSFSHRCRLDRPVGLLFCVHFVLFVSLTVCWFVCRQVFAMFVAALGHDIDHPGMNNSFEVPTTPRPSRLTVAQCTAVSATVFSALILSALGRFGPSRTVSLNRSRIVNSISEGVSGCLCECVRGA